MSPQNFYNSSSHAFTKLHRAQKQYHDASVARLTFVNEQSQATTYLTKFKFQALDNCPSLNAISTRKDARYATRLTLYYDDAHIRIFVANVELISAETIYGPPLEQC